MNKSLILFFIIIIFLLTGCHINKNDIKKKPNEQIISLNESEIKQKEIFLYSLFYQRLGIYSLADYKWSPINEEKNLFQYNFEQDNSIYTSGDSIKNNFEVLFLSNNSINTLISLNSPKDCIFPFAKYLDTYYYILYKDELAKSTNRSIVTINNGKIHEIFNSNKMISEGVFIGNYLYYSVYEDSKDLYDIYRFDVVNKKHSLFNQNIKSGNLFVFNDELYISDDNKIFNSNNEFEKKNFNYFINDHNKLIQFYINSNKDFVCSIMDTTNKKIIYEILSPINFEIKDKKIKIYTLNGVEELVFETK